MAKTKQIPLPGGDPHQVMPWEPPRAVSDLGGDRTWELVRVWLDPIWADFVEIQGRVIGGKTRCLTMDELQRMDEVLAGVVRERIEAMQKTKPKKVKKDDA